MRSAWRIVLRRWAMTNEVRPRSRRGQALLDQPLALGVEVAGGLVEDEDPRVGQDGPGDGQPLPLAAAEPHAALADQRVVAVGQALDELGGVGGLARRARSASRRGPAVAVGDVLGDRAVEQEDVLLDDAEQPPVALDLDVAEVDRRRAGSRPRSGRRTGRSGCRASSCPRRCGRPGRSSRRARRPGRCRGAPAARCPGRRSRRPRG